MLHVLLKIAIATTLFACTSLSFAVEKSTEAEAIALMQKAQDYIKKNGFEKAIIEFNRLDSPFKPGSVLPRLVPRRREGSCC